MSDPSIQSQRPAAHSYTIEVRFYGDQLDPTEISRRLGLLPSTSWPPLDATSSSRPGRPFWGYNGHGETGFQHEWSTLEDGLLFLARRLTPIRSTVIELSQAFDGIWWCGHFQCNFDGGPTLSPKTLAEVASFRMPLFIDNYFSSEWTEP